MNKKKKKKKKQAQVIVSGATGFIGQNLIPLLIKKKFEVVAIARNKRKALKFKWYNKVNFIFLDFHKKNIFFKPKKNAILIHLAWQGLPNYNSKFHIEENLPKNFNFIKKLIKSGVSKVLVTGTCFEYGFQHGPISETAPTKPANQYALAKDKLRQYLNLLKDNNPFTLQWLRLFYMHGKGQNKNSILAKLDKAIDDKQSVFNMSQGEQLRDYLPIRIVVKKIINILISKKNGIFNVCSGEPISIRRLVENRIKERGSKIKIKLGYYPYPKHEPMAFWGVNNN